MASRGSDVFRVKRRDQMEVLSSPLRWGIIDVVGSRGRCSIAEIAKVMEVSPNSLYYHVKKMVEVGLLVEIDKRKGRRRSESLYSLVKPVLEMSYDPKVKGSGEALARCAASMLRMTERDTRSALDRGDVIDYGPERNYHVGRLKIWLDADGLKKFNKLLDDMTALFAREGPKRRGQRFSFTMALVPLGERSDDTE